MYTRSQHIKNLFSSDDSSATTLYNVTWTVRPVGGEIGHLVDRWSGWLGGTFERCATRDSVIVSGDFDECVTSVEYNIFRVKFDVSLYPRCVVSINIHTTYYTIRCRYINTLQSVVCTLLIVAPHEWNVLFQEVAQQCTPCPRSAVLPDNNVHAFDFARVCPNSIDAIIIWTRKRLHCVQFRGI